MRRLKQKCDRMAVEQTPVRVRRQEVWPGVTNTPDTDAELRAALRAAKSTVDARLQANQMTDSAALRAALEAARSTVEARLKRTEREAHEQKPAPPAPRRSAFRKLTTVAHENVDEPEAANIATASASDRFECLLSTMVSITDFESEFPDLGSSHEPLDLNDRIQRTKLPRNDWASAREQSPKFPPYVTELTSDELSSLANATVVPSPGVPAPSQAKAELVTNANTTAPVRSETALLSNILSDRARLVSTSSSSSSIVSPLSIPHHFGEGSGSRCPRLQCGPNEVLCLKCFDCPCACDMSCFTDLPTLSFQTLSMESVRQNQKEETSELSGAESPTQQSVHRLAWRGEWWRAAHGAASELPG